MTGSANWLDKLPADERCCVDGLSEALRNAIVSFRTHCGRHELPGDRQAHLLGMEALVLAVFAYRQACRTENHAGGLEEFLHVAGRAWFEAESRSAAQRGLSA